MVAAAQRPVQGNQRIQILPVTSFKMLAGPIIATLFTVAPLRNQPLLGAALHEILSSKLLLDYISGHTRLQLLEDILPASMTVNVLAVLEYNQSLGRCREPLRQIAAMGKYTCLHAILVDEPGTAQSFYMIPVLQICAGQGVQACATTYGAISQTILAQP